MTQAKGAGIEDVMKRAVATGLFVSTCTIQAPDGVLSDGGQPSGNYVDVDGLVGLRCISAPVSEIRISATEMKSLAEIDAFAPRHVLLDGYYPALEFGVTVGWIAIIDDSPPWDIMGAESDSQKQMTRLECRSSSV